MQWLTAILAFATTMLIFALIVSAIIETLHRVLRRRQTGLKRMLEHYYDEVLLPHIQVKITADPTFNLPKAEFVRHMTRARAATKGGGMSVPFRALSDLPKEAFMERLGTTKFSEIVPKNSQGDQLLQDIAQKYETIGAEASQNFESWAAGWSMVVALIVAWTFYVHPYKLIETYMDDPEVAGKVAALGDASVERYRQLITATQDLQTKQKENPKPTPLTAEDLAKLMEDLKTDIENARTQVDKLSKSGAPIGWPDDDNSVPWQLWKHAAKSELSQADAKLAEAKANAELANAQADAELAKAQADAKLAEANVQLVSAKKVLDEAKASNKSNVDTANAAVDFMAANVAVAKAKAAQATASQQLARAIAGTTTSKSPQVDGFAIYFPKAPQDYFWLLMGGVLIGLGAPFWARLIGQLGQVRDTAGNMAEVLNSRKQRSSKAVVTALAAPGAPADEIPLTSLAFRASAEAKP